MPDTDPIALLREWQRTPFFSNRDDWNEWVADFGNRVEATCSAYRWQPKPDKPGLYRLRFPSRTRTRFADVGETTVTEFAPHIEAATYLRKTGRYANAEWCPVLPPPEGE